MSRFRILIAALAMLVASPVMAAEPASPSIAVIEAFQADLLQVMQAARRLDVGQRYERLLPVVEKTFNLRFMLRTIVGRHWDDATPEQRDRLTTAFKRMNIATVATLFDGYSGETFKVLGEKQGPQNTLLVQTNIVGPERTPVKLVYRMIQVDGRWQIIDVIVDDGISEVQTRKSEYAKSLAEGGIDRLSSVLSAKADELLRS